MKALTVACFIVLASTAAATTEVEPSEAATIDTPLRHYNFRKQQEHRGLTRCETPNDCSGTFLNNIDVEAGVRELTGPSFTICPGLSLECKLRCFDPDMINKTTKLYIKVGGEDASPTNYDAKDESLQCNKTVLWQQQQQQQNTTVTGLSYHLIATAFLRDVPFGCNCVDPNSGNRTTTTTWGCFSETDTVQLEQRQQSEDEKKKVSVAMKDLQVGDSILVERNSQKEKYESVYGFGHYHRTNLMTFWTLYTTNHTMPLELTGNHMIFIHSKGMVRADQVQVGDLVRTAANGSLQPVTRVVPPDETTPKKGIYMPLTRSGYLMVNGIQVSAYVSFLKELAPQIIIIRHPLMWWLLSEQTLFHAWMAPYRLYCSMPGGWFSRSANNNRCHPQYSGSTEDNGNDDNEGILEWLLLAKWLWEYANESCLAVQVIMGMIVFSTLAVVNGLEVVLESCSRVNGTTLAVFLIGLYCCSWFNKGGSSS